MQVKNFNDGVVGNKKLRASFTRKGELIRLLYGQADFKQFLEAYHIGMKVNDSNLIMLHDDINNTYSQKYVENTNILLTIIYNTYFNIEVEIHDFVPLSDNVLIRKMIFKNKNVIPLDIKTVVYSRLLTDMNNDTSGYVKNNSLIQYNHDYSICTFSPTDIFKEQINNSLSNLRFGEIESKDYIGMSNDSAVQYNIPVLQPGEEYTLNLFVYVNKNKDLDLIQELDEKIRYFKKLDVEKLEEDTRKYWVKLLKSHDLLKVNNKKFDEKIKTIYNRSILLFQILINEDTGGISAGLEIDEDKKNCGRYSFCWPRDGVYVTEALDLIGYTNISDKFYNFFCRRTQFPNGMWEQRYYTDLRLAPSWGYQIDETASVVFGAYAHYKVIRDKEFLKSNLDMLEKAINFLKEYVDDIFNGEKKMKKSYDIWEEYQGESLYSLSSIYAAFSAMKSIYREVKEVVNSEETNNSFDEESNLLDTYRFKIKDYCINTFYDETKKSFVRNLDDRRIDISTIAIIEPFKMIDITDEKVLNTVDKINFTLRTYTGGYVRYEHDTYMGGYNPWPIATLWMALYYLEAGDNDKALECFNFVVNTANDLGMLGEQVDNKTLKPAWVIGLTWSHAMFLITLDKLIKKGLL